MIDEQAYARLRDRLYQLQAQVDFLYKHLQLTYIPETIADEDPAIVAALKQNNLLLAMKLYREKTNASADVARDEVLAIKGRLGLS